MEVQMSVGIITLLGGDLHSMSIEDGGNTFARKVIEAAQQKHIKLQSISELQYADLDGDGKIEAKEIAALISSAHEKRAGREFQIVSSDTGVKDGHAVRNPNFDPKILSADLQEMTNPKIVEQAKEDFKMNRGIPSLKEMLDAIDKDTMKALKGITGGYNAHSSSHESPNNIHPQSVVQYGVRR